MNYQKQVRTLSFIPKKNYEQSPRITQRIKQVYIPDSVDKSKNKQQEKNHVDSNQKTGNSDNFKTNSLKPPLGGYLKRNRHFSNDINQSKAKQQISKGKNTNKMSELEARSDLQLKVYKLEKKLMSQGDQKVLLENKLKKSLEQIENLKGKIDFTSNQMKHYKAQKKKQQIQLQNIKRNNQYLKQSLEQVRKNNEQLKRNLKDAHINKKSLNNLKNLQNQIDYLTQKNRDSQIEMKKMQKEIYDLKKQNIALNKQISLVYKENKFSEQSESTNSNGEQKIFSLKSQVKNLKNQIQSNKSEKQIFLENILKVAEEKLYQKQVEVKKLQIMLRCIDRKKQVSIGEVKIKKDEQIKSLRKKFMKVTKDLRETKDKFQQKQKRKEKIEYGIIKKVKSSKLLGQTSESQQLTFELSAQI